MTHYYIIGWIVAVLIACEIYYIGKYFCIKNTFFTSNEPAVFTLGSIIYFFINFVLFFFIVWTKSEIIYYVIIFIAKEVLLIMFLFIKRDVFKGMKMKKLPIFICLMAMTVITITFNNYFNNALGLIVPKKVNIFQTWSKYKNVLEYLLKVPASFLNSWTLSMLSILIINNVISSFIITFSKKKGLYDYIISFIFTYILLLTFNFGYQVNSLIGIWYLLFAVQTSYQIIMFSRRRYGAIYGTIVMNIYFFNPNLFTAIAVLGIITILLYTYIKGPRASLFWVQMISPLLVISSLWIYPYSILGALIVAIFSIILYLFMVSIGRLEFLEKIDIKLYKIRKLLPIVVLLTILSASLVSVIVSKEKFEKFFSTKSFIIDSYGNYALDLTQSIFIYILILLLTISFIYIKFTKRKIVNYKIIFLLSFLTIISIYNSFAYTLIEGTNIEPQFKYIRVVAFMPLILLIPIVLNRHIKFKKSDKTWSEKLNKKTNNLRNKL